MAQTQNDHNQSAKHEMIHPIPIVVTGYMHSGTTLVQIIFGRSSKVFASYGETRYFSNLPIIKKAYPDLEDDTKLYNYVVYLVRTITGGYKTSNADLCEESDLLAETESVSSEDIDQLFALAKKDRDHARLLGTAYEYLSRKNHRTHWLDKCPSYIIVLDDIVAVHPNARIIELVRDPRDILASKLRRSKKRGNYDPIWDTLSWRASVRAADDFRRRYPKNILRVRYEDLAARPEEVVVRMCEFADLEYNDSLIDVYRINTSIQGLEESGISSRSIGRWRNTISPADVFLCQQIAKKEMVQLAYDSEQFPSTMYLNYPIAVGRSGLDLLDRMYTEWSSDGAHQLINRLQHYRLRIRAQMGR